jgi:hypothetical protein
LKKRTTLEIAPLNKRVALNIVDSSTLVVIKTLVTIEAPLKYKGSLKNQNIDNKKEDQHRT